MHPGIRVEPTAHGMRYPIAALASGRTEIETAIRPNIKALRIVIAVIGTSVELLLGRGIGQFRVENDIKDALSIDKERARKFDAIILWRGNNRPRRQNDRPIAQRQRVHLIVDGIQNESDPFLSSREDRAQRCPLRHIAARVEMRPGDLASIDIE
jgi:hypothetical protein